MPSTPPLHLDLFTVFILLGTVQAVLLVIFFLTGARRKKVENRLLAGLLLSLACITFEIFLNESRLIFRVLYLVNFAEPANFMLAPLLFLYLQYARMGKLPKAYGFHFLPAALYSVYNAWYYQQYAGFKYNSILDSFHLPYVRQQVAVIGVEDPLSISHYVNELTLVQILIYTGASLFLLGKDAAHLGAKHPRLRQMIFLVSSFLCFILLFIAVKFAYGADLGDYLLATLLAGLIYFISFQVMRGLGNRDEPAPLKEVPETAKYAKSTLDEAILQDIEQRLEKLMATEKLYLSPQLTLAMLAERIAIRPHNLSQALNERLGLSFFDYLARLRIQEAQRLLRQPTTRVLKIEEIAERVGYLSKSSFNTAFRRLVGCTPSQFRDKEA